MTCFSLWLTTYTSNIHPTLSLGLALKGPLNFYLKVEKAYSQREGDGAREDGGRDCIKSARKKNRANKL